MYYFFFNTYYNYFLFYFLVSSWSVGRSVSRSVESSRVGRSVGRSLLFLFFCARFVRTNVVITIHSLPQTTTMEEDQVQWIAVTDEMIKRAGYHKSNERYAHHRSNFFRNVRKHYTNNKDYRLTQQKIKGKQGSGGHNKQTLLMILAAYNDFLKRTYVLRKPKPKAVKHYIYVMHNPMFLHYGPNVYKIGYSENVERRVKDYETSFIESSTVVFSKEVPTKQCKRKLHKMMTEYRINPKREFFNCPLSRVKQLIDTL